MVGGGGLSCREGETLRTKSCVECLKICINSVMADYWKHQLVATPYLWPKCDSFRLPGYTQSTEVSICGHEKHRAIPQLMELNKLFTLLSLVPSLLRYSYKQTFFKLTF